MENKLKSSANSSLNKVRKEKNDELYTKHEDIETEIAHYQEQFRDKIVYCNCDDPTESNFFKYFRENFVRLQLKGLLCTGYKERDMFNTQNGVMSVVDGKSIMDGETKTLNLQGDGDFRSLECIRLLEQADIVVTNPPFSLGREYFAQLFKYGKKFLIVMNGNAVTYKEVFPFLKNGMMRIGYTQPKEFLTQLRKVENEKTQFEKEGRIYQKFGNIKWFTNLGQDKQAKPIRICRTFDKTQYLRYDNYDAINCDRIADIPIDLPVGETIGVPITIVDHIAADGLIYFDDGGINGGVQTYEVDRFRKGDDNKDLAYTHTHTHGFNRTSESLSDVSSSGIRPLCGGKHYAEQENAYQREGSLCENPYQTYKVIGHEHDVNGNGGDGVPKGAFWANGKQVFKRILIQRVK